MRIDQWFDRTGRPRDDDDGQAEHRRRLEYVLGYILARMDQIMLDTSKALASVRTLTTDVASLRALLGQVNTNLKDVTQKLADAIAAGDPQAIAAAQVDLEEITRLADTEDAQTKEALGANVQPAPPADGQS